MGWETASWIALILLFGAGAFLAWQYAYKKHPKEIEAGGRWLKNEFAEWFVGSWGQILGWVIIAWVFWQLLQMDGHFSRGLGEGSGVNPDLFQNLGWAYRFFAATFLVLAVLFERRKLKATALSFKFVGAFCSVIVVLHAMGFGLKALDGKRNSAVAVEEVAQSVELSTVEMIAAYEKQKSDIRADRDADVAALETSLQSELNDGNAGNDDAAREYYTPQINEVRADARERIAEIDDAMLAVRTSSTERRAAATEDIATSEKWAPLFVGLAMLFTLSWEPSDNAIWIAGVGFFLFWVLLGDAICIVGPPGMYKLHLRNAEFNKRSDASKEGHENATKRQNKKMMKMIEDLQKQVSTPAKKETVEIPDPPKPEPDLEVSIEDGEVTEVETEDEPEQTGTEDKPRFDPKATGDDPAWDKPDSRNPNLLPTKPNPTALTTKEDANGDEDDLSDESAGEEGDQAERGQAA